MTMSARGCRVVELRFIHLSKAALSLKKASLSVIPYFMAQLPVSVISAESLENASR